MFAKIKVLDDYHIPALVGVEADALINEADGDAIVLYSDWFWNVNDREYLIIKEGACIESL